MTSFMKKYFGKINKEGSKKEVIDFKLLELSQLLYYSFTFCDNNTTVYYEKTIFTFSQTFRQL